PVRYEKAPELERAVPADPEPDPGGQGLLRSPAPVLQVEVSGSLIPVDHPLFPKEVILDPPCPGTEGIEPVRALFPVQQKGNQALHGDRLPRTVGSAEEELSI